MQTRVLSSQRKILDLLIETYVIRIRQPSFAIPAVDQSLCIYVLHCQEDIN